MVFVYAPFLYHKNFRSGLEVIVNFLDFGDGLGVLLKICFIEFFRRRETGKNIMPELMEVIRKRESVRTYDESRPIEKEVLVKLKEKVNGEHIGPMGNTVRFRLLDLGKVSGEELRKLGTYGIIKGAPLFLLSAVRDKEGALEDTGYCMEKLILKATALGLGTCWLSGTFRRSSFSQQMELSEEELLPAITPVGYPGAKKRVVEKLFKMGTRSEKRKPWSKLFLDSDGMSSLSPEKAGKYREALEAVRLGPSSRNLQPWKIIRDEDGDFHLYLQGKREGPRAEGRVDSQKIDMGIAMCHFALVAEEKGLKGNWEKIKTLEGSEPPIGNLDYTASWIEKK